MAYFPSVPQESRDSYGNRIKKLDKNGKQVWSKAVDTDEKSHKKSVRRHKLKEIDKKWDARMIRTKVISKLK